MAATVMFPGSLYAKRARERAAAKKAQVAALEASTEKHVEPADAGPAKPKQKR